MPLMNLDYTEDVSKSHWDAIVRNDDDSYFFHSPTWAKILEKTYGYRTATRLYDIDGTEVLIPMMEAKKNGLKSYRSVPFGYGGIFSSSSLPVDVLQALLNNIVGGRCLSFDLLLPPFSNLSIPKSPSIREVHSEWNYTHVLSLEEGFEHIWKKKLKKHTRNQVRKAERCGVEVLEARSLEDVRAYYEMHEDATKRYYEMHEDAIKRWQIKKSLYPLTLFENMYRFGQPYVKLQLAVVEGKAIAGIVPLRFGKTVFSYAPTFLKEFANYCPNTLLYKNAIEEACNDGYKYFDAGSSGNLEGVRRFKEHLGLEQVEVRRYLTLSRVLRTTRLSPRNVQNLLFIMGLR